MLQLFLLSKLTVESFAINVRPMLKQPVSTTTVVGGGAAIRPRATWTLRGVVQRLWGPSRPQQRILRRATMKHEEVERQRRRPLITGRL